MMLIEIEGRLPGTNELVAANRRGWQTGAHQKKNYTLWCAACTKKSLRGQAIPYERIDLYVTFFEANRKRDPDNIVGGLKYILDGMVTAGAIPDDSQKYIGDIHCHIATGQPHVIVEIREAVYGRQEIFVD